MAGGFPSDRWDSTIDNYDYASDSDIEDMEDPAEGMRTPADIGVAAKTSNGGAPVKDGAETPLEDGAVGPHLILVFKCRS